MKKLRNIFLVCLFSLLFTSSVNADTLDLYYDDNIKTFTTKYKVLLDNVAKYLKDNASIIDGNYNDTSAINIANDKNVIMYLTQDIGDGLISIGIILNETSTSTSDNDHITSNNGFSFAYIVYKLTYDITNFEIIGINSYTNNITTANYRIGVADIFSNWYFDWRLGANTDCKFYNNSSNTFIINSDGSTISPKSWYDGGLYGFVNTLNNGFKEVLNDLGTFKNSNVLTYKIKDEEVGNNKELKLKLTFNGVENISPDNISVYKYGSNVYTQISGFQCVNDNGNSVCTWELKYNVYDSIDDKIMFDFKFDNSYNVKIESTNISDKAFSNYEDVEFEYKQLNFKELSGGVFYLRNYDNFDYMNDYLYNVDYNFRFTNFPNDDTFVNPTIYANDIKYSNTYLIEDSNNVFQYNFDNYNTLNNLGMEFIDFVFDSSLLVENKFSAFVVENPNYLGSNDTDNLDLYINYNSSLFNFNKFNSSVIVDNGSTNNYVSTGGDYNFIINGSQQTITGGVNSGHIVYFDEEINVQYKGGLQYFKDKIIDMFEFVSEFYNTMPEKFRVAFSLIFVLLIGIALFRLLL